ARARHSDYPGSCGSDRRQTCVGTDLRGRLRGQCVRLPSRSRGGGCSQGRVPALTVSRGYTDVVDADLARYFDSIPHDDLLKSVARRVADGSVLRLIKLWLKAPIEERDGDGKAADGWRREEQARHASGWCCEPIARQYLHEPVPEALASKRLWRSFPCPCRLLCLRLRHP